MLNDVLETHFVCPQDPANRRTIVGRAHGQAAIVVPTVFHNPREWAQLADPSSQTGRSVVCGNLTAFAVFGFFIQAELSLLLAGSAAADPEANSIVVTCHYRLQLSFAQDFLQRFLATFEWAHQEDVGELFQKGIIGFMGPPCSERRQCKDRPVAGHAADTF